MGNNKPLQTQLERIASLETKVGTLATSADIASLRSVVEQAAETNSKQHDDMRVLLITGPNSLQNQLLDIGERAFGDNPTSLKSRVTEIESGAKVSRGVWAFIAAFFGSLGTVLGFKWDQLMGFFHHR